MMFMVVVSEKKWRPWKRPRVSGRGSGRSLRPPRRGGPWAPPNIQRMIEGERGRCVMLLY